MDKQRLAERFVACTPDVQAWAEAAGIENMRRRVESGRDIGTHAQNTLTVLLAGVGGGAALALPALEDGWGVATTAAALLAAYLAVCAVVLVWRCMLVVASPAVHNEPQNLLVPGAQLVQLRAGELANLQERIAQQTALNLRRAVWLNRVRLAAATAPGWAVLAGMLLSG